MQIELELGPGSVIRARLDFRKENTDFNIAFTSLDSKEEIINDNFFQFNTVEVDNQNPLRIFLKGKAAKRTFVFQDSSEVSEFFEILQQNAHLDFLPGKERVFSISRKTAQQNIVRDYISGGINIVKSFVGTQQPTQQELNTDTETDGIKNGIVFPELPDDFQPVPYTNESQLRKVSHLLLHREDIGKIWLSKLPAEGTIQDYSKLLAQWQGITRGQWEHSYALRKYVVDAESLVMSSKIAAPPYDAMMFSVLMSLFAFHFFRLELEPQCGAFLEAFVRVIAGTKDDGAARVFWPFLRFHTLFVGEKSELRKFSIFSVKKQLEKFSPSTAKMIEAFGLKNLVFAKDHVKSLFTRERGGDDQNLILTAIICSEDPLQFLESMAAACLVLLQCRLQRCENLERFGDLFDEVVPSIDTRLLLHNAEIICDYIKM